jgi:hypothetical protein
MLYAQHGTRGFGRFDYKTFWIAVEDMETPDVVAKQKELIAEGYKEITWHNTEQGSFCVWAKEVRNAN